MELVFAFEVAALDKEAANPAHNPDSAKDAKCSKFSMRLHAIGRSVDATRDKGSNASARGRESLGHAVDGSEGIM